MADLQRVRTDYDSVDQQLQDPLLLGQRRLIEPRPHALAERRQVGPDLLRRQALATQSLLLLVLYRKNMSPSHDLFASLLQLTEVDHLRLIGAEQAPLLAVEAAQSRFNLPARRALVGVERVGLSELLLELRGPQRRIFE